MSESTGIQWTDATWNPVTGCDKVSPGCAHCYAERVALRLWPSQYPRVIGLDPKDESMQLTRPREFTDVMCHEDRLDQPLRWKRPRRVFVNSMSDLFHEAVPDDFIDRVFAVMARAPQHTFQVLSKRADRMRAYVVSRDPGHSFHVRMHAILDNVESKGSTPEFAWPLPNVWLGVSVENQYWLDIRVPLLLQTPAAVRFISAEPLLGCVDIAGYIGTGWRCACGWHDEDEAGPAFTMSADQRAFCPKCGAHDAWVGGLDWVIVGGESGVGARPFDVAWARAIVQQCQAAGVPVFVKQLGADPRGQSGIDFTTERHDNGFPVHESRAVRTNGGLMLRDRKGGDPDQWPADLRVRQFPAVTR